MPPSDTSPTAVNRYLTRILAALAKGAGGELRIKRRLLRQVEDEPARQVLLEDLDSRADEIVLRFGSKHSAIYPVEAEQPSAPQTPARPMPAQPSAIQSQSAPANPGKLPYTDEQLVSMETKIRQMRNLAAIRKQRPPAP
jgi:hypothetical protein